MKKYKRWITLVLALVILGIVGVAAIAASELPWESSGEPGALPAKPAQVSVTGNAPDEGNGDSVAPAAPAADAPSTEDRAPTAGRSGKPTALQADDNGYTGDPPAATENGALSSSEDGILTPPDWSTFFTEPQPDDSVDGGTTDDAGINWSSLFYYYHAAGSAFRPRDSSVDWANDSSGGCLYLTAGSTSEIFNIHLEIPNGTLIEYLRIYYYDTSASNSIAWVTRYNDEGGYEDVVNVSSDGNAGYGTQLSAQIAHVVDTTSYSYVLNWRPVVSGSTMQLCGLRVAYRLPD